MSKNLETPVSKPTPQASAASDCSAWHRTTENMPPPLDEVEVTHPSFIGTRTARFYPLSGGWRLTDCTHPAQNAYIPVEGSAWRLMPNEKLTDRR